MSAEQDLANANVQIANLITEVTRFRDAAMGLNDIYPTITEGRQTVADGKYFSVPGGGAYMRLYRRQGTTAELVAEFPDRETVLNIQQGVAAFTDRGVVGSTGPFFSLSPGGSSPQVNDDLNQTRVSGSYYALGAANSPAGNGHLLWSKYSTDGLYDKGLFLPQNSAQRLFILGQHNGVFAPPVEAYTTGNLLGAVSQLAGAPTGAVIQRGSNSDGVYLKFAGGLLICLLPESLGRTMQILNQISGDIYRSASTITWDFPLPFSSAPICYSQTRLGLDVFGVAKVPTTTECVIGAISLSGSKTDQPYSAIAIGIWHE